MTDFDPRKLARQFDLAFGVRAVLFGAILLGWLLSVFGPINQTGLPMLLLTGGLVGWVVASIISARANRELMQLVQAAMEEAEPEELERHLRAARDRFTLQDAVRAMAYQQQALLARRMNRPAEAAGICAALLRQPRLRLQPTMRVDLLLILAETTLNLDDLGSAYHALQEASGHRLSLLQAAQFAMLRVRYDMACGYPQYALVDLPAKVELADLMGYPATPLTLALLAEAAARCGYGGTASWLRERARLLGDPETGAGPAAQPELVPESHLTTPLS